MRGCEHSTVGDGAVVNIRTGRCAAVLYLGSGRMIFFEARAAGCVRLFSIAIR